MEDVRTRNPFEGGATGVAPRVRIRYSRRRHSWDRRHHCSQAFDKSGTTLSFSTRSSSTASPRTQGLGEAGQVSETLPAFAASGPSADTDWFIARLESLRDVPGMPYAYWASDSLRALFRHFPPWIATRGSSAARSALTMSVAETRFGLQTSDDSAFPEVLVGSAVQTFGRSGPPFAKGWA